MIPHSSPPCGIFYIPVTNKSVLGITLRHPAACIANDSKIIAENTKICEDTAKDLLGILYKLYRLKSLDTTWYCLAIYVTAIFSTLVAHWERRHETNAAEVQALREDMKLWLTLLAETGNMMGKFIIRFQFHKSLIACLPL